ncbi:MAG TPA: putative aminohydrolase SsnA [Candidatus Aphodomorpha intestinavium]|uniref:Aminohydrolase SsnA n=1 Tax=Candidatus Aphodomorpha intestinavium TaxID=2840672 RepID=A0A9D1N3L1_9FIRM|nr:putative aminohydrolase SsnA [Candidatus Aphodomorpha intestinavium]
MLFIGNGKVITRDGGAFFENGAVVTDGEKIVAVGDGAALRRQYPDAELIDAHGGTIMPGLINMHNHIYSAFARGLSIRGYAPKDFSDILEGQWWKIDRHLTHENNRLSALAVYADCIKNGVTTVFDHHASYFDVPGSLDDIASAATELGVRASLCYEVSDRDGEKKAMEAVLENERFILRAQQEGSDMLHGMMGLHASFTVSDETLRRCEAHRHGAGYHVHCAEGPADLAHCLKTYGKRIIERFCDAGVLGERTLAVHCVHINRAEMQLLRDTGAMVVHNPESNMGNAVGCGPVLHMLREGVTVGLGTDGYTNDMLESYKVGNIIHKHHLCDPTVAWGEIPAMLFEHNAAMAGRFLKAPVGVLRPGAYADVIVTDYDPLTPMDGANANSHILFGMNGRSVTHTICNGKVLMRERVLTGIDERALMAECRASAQRLWTSING